MRLPRIRHRNELTEMDWENAVQGLGKLFPTPFSDLSLKSMPIFRPGVGRIKTGAQTKFLKIHFEFAYYSFFLIHLELKRQIHLHLHLLSW